MTATTTTTTTPITPKKKKGRPLPALPWPAATAALLVVAAAAGGAVRKATPVTPAAPPAAPLLPPRGPFPPGCAWAWSPSTGTRFSRGRGGASEGGGGSVWKEGGGARPHACDLPARLPLPFTPASLTTAASCDAAACTYTNLWYADGAWYALVNGTQQHQQQAGTGEPPNAGWALSRHVAARPLRAGMGPGPGSAWARAVSPAAAFIPGTAALLDYRFFLHPTAIGHWAEHALGLAATVRARGAGGKEPVARLLILHAPRAAVGEWVRIALAAALRSWKGGEAGDDGDGGGGGGGGGGPSLPPLHFQAEAAAGPSPPRPDLAAPLPLPTTTPPGAPLEGVPPGTWLLFQEVVVPRDPPPGTPAAAVVGTDTARAFREAFWGLAGVKLPGDPNPSMAMAAGARPPPPTARHILFLAKAANRRVLGGEALKQALLAATNASSLAVAAFTDATPVAEQLAALARARLVVGPHTSALAAAALLPPGAALLELVPFAWTWGGLDGTFAAMAGSLGDVHAAAWRAGGRAQAAWADGRDAARFAGWAPGECGTEGCVEAVTRADLVVDVRGVAEAAAGLVARAGLW